MKMLINLRSSLEMSDPMSRVIGFTRSDNSVRLLKNNFKENDDFKVINQLIPRDEQLLIAI